MEMPNEFETEWLGIGLNVARTRDNVGPFGVSTAAKVVLALP